MSDPTISNHLLDKTDGVKRSHSAQFSNVGDDDDDDTMDEEMDHYENIKPQQQKKKERKNKTKPIRKSSRKTVKTEQEFSD